MIWLTRDMVEAFHRESLARFGGADGIRDEGLLLSAMSRAENIHACEPDADAFRLAAAYGAGVVKNHPFVDGNNRTGVLAAVVSLGINGIELEFDEAMVFTMVYGLAAGEITEDRFADWLRGAAVSR